ncbi:pesticidal protein Cry7Aa [Flavobacterium sp. 14A]|uniref:glycoside hydrolase family 130 protein n=1 Tax=Flavobacterium sp. 14A TaxID=2735896 RepID=UPI00156E6365|nr:pesticidal protein Cry7Aa [Flavobacterium sp. 14A]NRT10846.1 putative GH43/DUF377 family glycosyl hydrolase [Flavobacterium sp. 14A]
MIQVKKEGVVLSKTILPFENEGVLNPAVIKEGNFVHMFYRAVAEGNHSTIGYCKFDGPLTLFEIDRKPLLITEFDYECQGMEDPRIVKIEDLYYLTYTGFDGINALGCLAISKDLIHFEKKGVIVPQISFEEFDRLAEEETAINPKYFRYNEHTNSLEKDNNKYLVWDKNVIFFPRKINENFYFLHRIRPEVQIVVGVKDLKDLTEVFYQDYLRHFNDYVVLSSKFDHEISYVGGGCPPIETAQGWLLIYHGVKDGADGFIYAGCAALLDLENPQKEIARLPYPLFKPELDWELNGEVNNVCFPTGTALFEDTLYIYYGAADERIACASVSFSGLLNELILYKKEDDK